MSTDPPSNPPPGEAPPASRTAKRRGLLTDAQARALVAMARSPDGNLRGISWTTARALRALGLCELGPGRRGRLTAEGLAALRDLARRAEAGPPQQDEDPAPHRSTG